MSERTSNTISLGYSNMYNHRSAELVEYTTDELLAIYAMAEKSQKAANETSLIAHVRKNILNGSVDLFLCRHYLKHLPTSSPEYLTIQKLLQDKKYCEEDIRDAEIQNEKMASAIVISGISVLLGACMGIKYLVCGSLISVAIFASCWLCNKSSISDMRAKTERS